jgi:hypothetical protein
MENFRYDYRGMGEWLKGPEARDLVRAKANRAEELYQAIVTRRTGQLAESTRVELSVGGARNDRWVADLVVGAPYAASHEFGTQHQSDADDLNVVLSMLGSV